MPVHLTYSNSLVNYAASVALELRGDPSNPTVRFAFKNGTDDAAYNVYPLFNSSGDIPLSQFASNLSVCDKARASTTV